MADTWWHLGWIRSWRCTTLEPSSPSSPTSSRLELPVCPWARGGCCLQPRGMWFRSLSSPQCTINDLSFFCNQANTRSFTLKCGSRWFWMHTDGYTHHEIKCSFLANNDAGYWKTQIAVSVMWRDLAWSHFILWVSSILIMIWKVS